MTLGFWGCCRNEFWGVWTNVKPSFVTCISSIVFSLSRSLSFSFCRLVVEFAPVFVVGIISGALKKKKNKGGHNAGGAPHSHRSRKVVVKMFL